jgi:DNA-binding LacI/PurR family transcriptional regulator
MRVTIRDIAERAGVSKTAVSFAFNDPTRLAKKTRDRIMAIAGELGYSPDPIARTLTTKRVGSIGFLLPQGISVAFKNPFLSQIIQGLGFACQREGFSLTIVPPLRGCIFQAIRSAAVDGFVTLGLETEMKALSLLQQRHIPFVTIDGNPSEGIASINTNDRCGAYQAMAHLLALGHRRIGILCLDGANKIDHAGFSLVRDKRLEGYDQALQEVGLSLQDPGVRVLHCECSLEGGRRGARALLCDPTAPTAVAAMSDIIALGVHLYCGQRGLRIPDQLSLAGYDDIPESALVTPGLTTVGQQGVEKGKKAGEMLCSIIHKKHYEPHFVFQRNGFDLPRW